MNKVLLGAAAFWLGAAATQADAASFYSFTGDLQISLIGFSGPAEDIILDVDSFADFDARTLENAVATADASSSLVGETALLGVSGSGTAFGMPFGDADSFGFADFYLILENPIDAPVTLDFALGYDLFASVGGAPAVGEDAYAEVYFSLLVDSREVFAGEVVADLLFGPPSDSLSGFYTFEVVVPALGFADLDLVLDGFGVATSVAPIPLPAAAPLLVGAFGALALFRRRKAA